MNLFRKPRQRSSSETDDATKQSGGLAYGYPLYIPKEIMITEEDFCTESPVWIEERCVWLAKSGNPDAQALLALLYMTDAFERGQDLAAAEKWASLGAHAGSAYAQWVLAWVCFAVGKRTESARWLHESAGQKFPAALVDLAKAYAAGKRVIGNLLESERLSCRAILAGHPGGLFQLAALYENGQFGRIKRAFAGSLRRVALIWVSFPVRSWYSSKYLLGLHRKWVTNTQDPHARTDDKPRQFIQMRNHIYLPKGIDLLLYELVGDPLDVMEAKCLARAHSGLTQAQALLALLYLIDAFRKGRDLDSAAHWAQLSANAGDAYGQWVLAWVNLEQGMPLVTVELLRQSAEQRFPAALFDLARCYVHGVGVALDLEASERYMRRALLSGHLLSLKPLGTLWATGQFGWARRTLAPMLKRMSKWRVITQATRPGKFRICGLTYIYPNRYFSKNHDTQGGSEVSQSSIS